MLTGRKDAFLYEEHYDDVSGYSNPGESEHDHFTIGHTSVSYTHLIDEIKVFAQEGIFLHYDSIKKVFE